MSADEQEVSFDEDGWEIQRWRRHITVKGLNATGLYAFKWLRRGIPRQSSGWDFVLLLLGARVQSLVGQLRACKLHGAAKINTHKIKTFFK